MDNKDMFVRLVLIVMSAVVLIFGMSQCTAHYQRLDQQQQQCIEAGGYWNSSEPACVQTSVSDSK